MKTLFTEMLKIKYPIMQGGMQHLATAELASAVSNAGALGTINSTIYENHFALEKAIIDTRSKTKNPFCVNVSMLPEENISEDIFKRIEIIISNKVSALETSGNFTKELAVFIKENKRDLIWIHKAGSIRHAISAEKMGADIVTIVGSEVGGHPHKDKIGTIVIANKASKILKIPILSAGGYCNANGLISALSMGCSGIVMGTRFVASKECKIHNNFKDWIINSNENDTTLCLESINNVIRVAKNNAAAKCQNLEKNNASIEELMSVISGKISKKNYETGDFDNTIFAIGQAIGLITEIHTCKEIIDNIIYQSEIIMEKLNSIKK